MLDHQLLARLEEIATRIRRLRLCRALTVGWVSRSDSAAAVTEPSRATVQK